MTVEEVNGQSKVVGKEKGIQNTSVGPSKHGKVSENEEKATEEKDTDSKEWVKVTERKNE